MTTRTDQTTSALWPALLPPSQHGDDHRCLSSARGVRLRFTDGSQALCGTSGLWNANLGYGNENITKAVSEALTHASYLGTFRWENTLARQAADQLRDVCGADQFAKILFSTSGGAANDLMMKVARHYQAARGEGRRRLVVGLRGGYHGLTFGSAALTSDDLGQRVHGVDRSLVRHVPPHDLTALERLLHREGDQVAAIVVEPVLGTGTVVVEQEWLAGLARLRDQHGFLVVADEVACGFGRLGHWFGSDAWPLRPDLLVTSKGLTNGTCAAAAVAVSHEVWEAFRAGDLVLGHAETQAGTAVSCAAVVATIEQMYALDAVQHARRVGDRLEQRLQELTTSHPQVTSLSGAGCFRTVHVAGPDGRPLHGAGVGALVASVRDAGAVVHPGPDGVQLVPALVYTDAEVDELVDCVRAGLDTLAAGAGRR
jgi:adenosylmethionine-8-amino-7-oxononanoate aminotransferase